MNLRAFLLIPITATPCQSFSLSTGQETPEIYPLSQRKALLIKEAQRLDPSIKDGKGSYSPSGWSNRLGAAITPAAPNVYTADRPFYWNKIDVGCRMTIIRLSNDDLIIHSPVGLDPSLMEAIDKLGGRVAHVISPNYEHVKYAKQWGEEFTEANMWGCPGLSEKEEEVRWAGEIGYHARPPGYAKWSGTNEERVEVANDSRMWDWKEFQPLHIDVEVNPFTGRPFFNEVVFYHSESKTLLTTDLYWNYPRGDGVTNGQVIDEIGENNEDYGAWELAPYVGEIPFGSKVWKVGMDKVFRPFYNNFMIKNEQRDKFKDIARFITCGSISSGWDVETIIPAHGDIIRGKELCRKVLERHFNIDMCDEFEASLTDELELHYTSEATLQWLQKMALSYKLQKGEDLIEVLIRESSDSNEMSNINPSSKDSLLQLARICAKSSLPIASHDFLRDPNKIPIYNYGNHAFLTAFGYEWNEFIELPSSKCVDTKEDVEERQKLLDEVKKDISSQAYNMDVVRVRKDKKKILLKGVNLFNMYDLDGSSDIESARILVEKGKKIPIGQAVWIKDFEYLDKL